ncbi:MAG: YceH family protein [Acidimicrobiales bacterium]
MPLPEMTPAQIRVVGCLLEKELATPDVYPLTMNGLLAACNQTTNRHPVAHYEEPTVSNALENLRAGGLVRIVYSRSNRADRFRQVLDEQLDLNAPDRAVLAMLMVRGPQTVAELRARTARLHAFDDQGAGGLDAALGRLAARAEPLVLLLDRQPGQKEPRWAHLLGGPPSADDLAAAAASAPASSGGGTVGGRSDRLADLEEAVQELRDELGRLRADHAALEERLGDLLE